MFLKIMNFKVVIFEVCVRVVRFLVEVNCSKFNFIYEVKIFF